MTPRCWPSCRPLARVRWRRAEEIAGPAIFLASSAADFVTGEMLRVDGGYAIR